MVIELVKDFALRIFDRYLELVTAPAKYTDMIWIILPVVVMMFLMEFYFGRYEKEKLGWNSAVANSIVLIFVSLDLFRQIYQGGFGGFFEANPDSSLQITTIIAGVVATLGVWLLIIDFFHMLPEKIAYVISSHLHINMIAYLSIILVYTNLPYGGEFVRPIPLDIYTFISAILLFFSLWIVFWLVHKLEPKESDPKQTEEEKEEKIEEDLFADI